MRKIPRHSVINYGTRVSRNGAWIHMHDVQLMIDDLLDDEDLIFDKLFQYKKQLECKREEKL